MVYARLAPLKWVVILRILMPLVLELVETNMFALLALTVHGMPLEMVFV
jgi:hypothetical protein